MERNACLTAAEATVLDGMLPPGLTEDMQQIAYYLFEALAMEDERAGQSAPSTDWLAHLKGLARTALLQLDHLARNKGGHTFYMGKGLVATLTARDREMCAKFRGDNYDELAAEHGLTIMRVRQIVGAWQRERFLMRQGILPGLEA
jgi:hypothetical protein